MGNVCSEVPVLAHPGLMIRVAAMLHFMHKTFYAEQGRRSLLVLLLRRDWTLWVIIYFFRLISLLSISSTQIPKLCILTKGKL